MSVAFIDFETRSTVDLNRCGVEKYAAHPLTSVLVLCWAFDDGEVVTSCPMLGTLPPDAELFAHVEAGGTVVAHNARFELHLWRMMTARHGWPEIRPEQLRCTMAAARALSLPGGLDPCARALRLPVEKDDVGRRVMLKLCKPRKPRKHEPQDAIIWNEDPADLARLAQYCATDVEVEREIYKTLLQLSPAEQELWCLDQRINDRGVCLDVPAVELLLDVSEREKLRLKNELRRLTGGEVSSPGAKTFLPWLASQGLTLPNVRKHTIGEALARADLTPHVRRALEIRAEHSKASTAKLKAMRNGAADDWRARGLLEYHGAGTGRWAGRRIQTQNMPRTPDEFEVEDAENVIAWASVAGGEVGMSAEYGKALDAVSWSLRSLITAGSGNSLLCADYSNIEGRVLAWLAGERWKIAAFEDLDAGTGHDLYKLAYSKSFGVRVEDVTKPQRQIGKVQELALGYQGGHGAFLSMGANYGIDLAAIAAAVRDAVTPGAWDDAVSRYWGKHFQTAEEFLADVRAKIADEEDIDEDEFEALELGEHEYAAQLALKGNYDLGAEQWAAIRIIVDGWRAAHPETVQFWRNLERAALEAVEYPGRVCAVGPIRYRKTGDFLYCRLPSGRALAYPYARVALEPSKFDPEKKDKRVRFEGVDGRTKRWCKQALYGGLCAENVTQATARDILADAIKRLERAGIPVVMHVHDEIVSELPRDVAARRYPEFLQLMADKEPWAEGLPVAVAGWEGRRYRK